MTEAAKKWNDEVVDQLVNIVGNNVDTVVPVTAIESAAVMIGVTKQSVASKLRKMGYTVESMAAQKSSVFSEEEAQMLSAFLNSNPGQYTYKEIASEFCDGKFSPKQVQGKILHLDLTGLVKPTEATVVAKSFTDEQEAQVVSMVEEGLFIEDIAEALGKPVNSVRGKALSLVTKGIINSIPPQRHSSAKEVTDPIADLGEGISTMTIAEIAECTGKTERGIKTTLTRRGISVADYNGAAKQAKAQAKRVD